MNFLREGSCLLESSGSFVVGFQSTSLSTRAAVNQGQDVQQWL
jgi:hypothetical protein